jgi:hypothetical protein
MLIRMEKDDNQQFTQLIRRLKNHLVTGIR